MSLITAAANQSKQHNSQVAFEIFGEKRREKQFPGKNHSKSSQSWDKMNKERFSSKSRVGTMHEERFSPKLRVGTICDEERVSPKSRVGKIYDEDRFSPKLRVGTICDEERFSSKSRVGTINDEERYKKSLTSSPLYRSTLDSLVDEDNVVRVTEDLKVFYFSFEKIFVNIFSRLH